MISLPDNRSISDGFDPNMTQDDLLFLGRIHCTYDHRYPQWENMINRRAVDVNALFYEINIRINHYTKLGESAIYGKEYVSCVISELCAVKDYVGSHPELYPTMQVAI